MTNRIKELRDLKGISALRLANAIGTGRSTIVKLERGERRLTVDWLVRIAKGLDVDPKLLLPDAGLPSNDEEAKAVRVLYDLPGSLEVSSVDFGPADLPIFGKAEGGPTGVLIMPDNQKPLGYTYRPAQLRGVEGAFAVFAVGESMFPMYKAGQILWIHPGAPPIAGEGVLIVKTSDEAIIKEFVNERDDSYTVKEYRPKERKMTIAKADIRHAYRILGAISLR